jgi:hypothetical protein
MKRYRWRTFSQSLVIPVFVFAAGAVDAQSTTPSPTPTVSQRGRFSVKVTYGTNTLLTRRPDESAMVLLFPENYHPAKKMSTPADIMIGDALGTWQASDTNRARYAEADGDGKVLFTGLPVGRYQVIVVSKHTIAGPNLRAASKELLLRYFTDSSFGELVSQLKTDEAWIEILPDETTEKSFHFE